MKINIKEIAKKAGVSVATISRAMNNETRNKVATDTLKQIDSIVEKYSYTPNSAAKSLRKTNTKIIGIVFPYVHNIFYSSYYTHILSGVANSLLDSDYQFKLLLIREGDRKIRYDFKSGERVDGLIVTQWFRFFSKDFMAKINVPCFVINDFDNSVKAFFVCGDNFKGGQIAAEHLYAMGHRRIGVILGPSWSIDSRFRLKGFRYYLDKLNNPLNPDLVVKGDYDDDKKTASAVDELLQKEKGISAIFCCNDNMALAALNRLKELGISCPDQISVMGYDDDFRAASAAPPLTTICVPIYDLAAQATVSLIKYLKNLSSKDKIENLTLIPPYLVKRSTVKEITNP